MQEHRVRIVSEPGLPSGVTITYSQQYRRCGKLNCRACRPGAPGHGPYWYAYWWEGERMRSRYLGKRAPIPDAPTPAGAVQPLPQLVADSRLLQLRVRTLGDFTVWRGEEPIPA